MNPTDPQITAFLIRAQGDWDANRSDSLYEDLRDELAMLLFSTDPDALPLDLEDDDDYDVFMNELDYYSTATDLLTHTGITI